MFIEVAFFHCLSAALFSTFAFGQIESAGFYSALVVVFIISYALDTSNWDVRHPFAHLIIDGLLKLAAVYVFFYLSSGKNIYIVFWAFFAYSMYINLVLDSFERYKVTKDRIVFNFGYAAIFLLLAAVSFGSTVYGNISKKIGGGKSLPMTVGLTADSLENYPIKLNLPVAGEVVYSTPDNIYVVIKKDTLIIPRTSVKWMSFRELDNNALSRLTEGVKEDVIESTEQDESNKHIQSILKSDATDR